MTTAEGGIFKVAVSALVLSCCVISYRGSCVSRFIVASLVVLGMIIAVPCGRLDLGWFAHLETVEVYL